MAMNIQGREVNSKGLMRKLMPSAAEGWWLVKPNFMEKGKADVSFTHFSLLGLRFS